MKLASRSHGGTSTSWSHHVIARALARSNLPFYRVDCFVKTLAVTSKDPAAKSPLFSCCRLSRYLLNLLK